MTIPTSKQRLALAGISFALLSILRSSDAFLSPLPQNSLFSPTLTSPPRNQLFRLFALPDIKDMKIGEMRSELESYGISTRPFLEKSEFVSALEKARAEGLKPKNDNKTQQPAAEPKTNGNNNNNQQQTTTTKSSSSGSSREERLKAEMEKAKAMRVSELKEKLKSMGVNTKSFFEKTEFVRAYAEAVVDGVNGSRSSSKASSSSSEEPYDPEYRDVVVQKFDPQSQQRYLLSGTIIDIKLS